MKFVARMSLLWLFVAIVAWPLLADEKESKRQKKEKDRSSPLEVSTLKRLQPAELTQQQIDKIKELVAQYDPKLVAARKKENELIPAEQRRARAEAAKKAKEEGKELVFAYKLNPEQQELLDEARKETRGIQAEFNKAVMALLSAEQKEKLPAPKRGKRKPND